MDFEILHSEQEYLLFKSKLVTKFGVSTPTLRNEPERFPILITACFVNDLNGAGVNLKHISLNKLKKLLTHHS